MSKTKLWITNRRNRKKQKQAKRCIGCNSNNEGFCISVGDWCHLVSYCSKGVG